jgi:hypothetical protein
MKVETTVYQSNLKNKCTLSSIISAYFNNNDNNIYNNINNNNNNTVL